MSHTRGELLTAAGLGAVTGLRTVQALAWVARERAARPVSRRDSRVERWLGSRAVATALAGLAVGELVADKLPSLPPRIDPGPLTARFLVGGLVGALATGDDRRAAGAAAGAGAALLAAFAGWLYRTRTPLVSNAPDAALAAVEDALAVLTARGLVRRL